MFRYFFFGSFSTAVDFAMLNLGVYVLHLPLVLANVVSLTIAIAADYFINKKIVFRRQPPAKRHIGYFLAVTLVGVYGLQSGIVELLAQFPLAQSTIAGVFATVIGHVPFGALESNIAKLIATVASSLWNFMFFRKLIFTGRQAKLAG